MGRVPSVIANTVVFGILVYVALLHAYYPDLYYRSVQEDEYLEWATFWAFALATWGWLWAAVRQRYRTGQLPWFLTSVGLFCFVVAMEEISWAQRIFAYRPPTYFLAENFQQELNFHNVVSTDLRKFALYTILFGYGILLPILARIPVARRLLDGIGVVAPPLGLAPSFAAALILSLNYPWKYTNETVELMIGGSFLVAAVASMARFSNLEIQRQVRTTSLGILAGTVLVIGLGLVTVATARYGSSHDPFTIELASVEIATLRRDFLEMAQTAGETFPNRKNLHKRIYTYENKYGGGYLYTGQFSQLAEGGMPKERADFFLDPWSVPYWIKLRWNAGRTRLTAFVYSFGPNRRRDSRNTEIRGDDVGAFIFENERVRGRK